MTRRQLVVTIGSFAVAGVFLAVALFFRPAGDGPRLEWVGELAMDVPSTLAAGEQANVVITAPGSPDGVPVTVVAFGAVNTVARKSVLFGESATVVLPSSVTEHSGLLPVVARVGRIEVQGTVEVLAGSAVNPIDPLVGPRSIAADGADETMVVVAAGDRFGNPIVDGELVELVAIDDQGGVAERALTVEAGIAAQRIQSTTRAGRITVSATVDGVDGPARVYDQFAGRPESVEVAVDDQERLADGFTLHEVATGELRDRFGNRVADGVAASIVIRDRDGRVSVLGATVQNGRVRTRLEAPDKPGTILVEARVSGVASEPIALDFESAVAQGVAALGRDGRSVVIGPVFGARGGWVPDGTMAVVIDRETGDELAELGLRNGAAVIALPADWEPVSGVLAADGLAVRILDAMFVVGASR